MRGAANINPENEFLKRYNELIKSENNPNGYPISTLNLIFCGTNNAISKSDFSLLCSGKEEKGKKTKKPIIPAHNMEVGNKFIKICKDKGFKDADNQAPLYLRTTEEMLAEFAYLGSDKAEEIVIENPNKIADMCEKIAPVRPDKCPPVIENSDQLLRDICHKKAHEMYGSALPKIVEERLERELNSIISNG